MMKAKVQAETTPLRQNFSALSNRIECLRLCSKISNLAELQLINIIKE